MTEAQRAKFFEIRRLLDELAGGIQPADEAAFNAAAKTINDHLAAFRVWRADADYKRGALTVDPDTGSAYWAMHDNGKTSGQVHKPGESPTIWARCHGTSPETAWPFVAESYNTYMNGHYCTEGGGVYRCLQDNIVYAPSVLPGAWEEVTE